MKHVITIEGQIDPAILDSYLYSDIEDDIASLNDSGLGKLTYTINKGKG